MSKWEVEVNIVYDGLVLCCDMQAKAGRNLLLAVQTASNEGLRLDNVGGVGKFVSREGEGQMKEGNRALGLPGIS